MAKITRKKHLIILELEMDEFHTITSALCAVEVIGTTIVYPEIHRRCANLLNNLERAHAYIVSETLRKTLRD